MLYTHVYVSKATSAFSRTQLERMCDAFATANARHAVTGMMFYIGDHFVQILEGERHVVWQLIHNIRADARNERFRTLYHGRLLRRRYPRWNMRVMRLDDRVVLPPAQLQRLKQCLEGLMKDQCDRQSSQRLLCELPRLIPLDHYAAIRAT